MLLLVAFQAFLLLLILSITGTTNGGFNTSLYFNGSFYVAKVGVGSPPQTQYLFIDTGSVLTWAQCQPCPESSCYPKQHPLFNPTASSSFADIACGDLTCYKIYGSNHRVCDKTTCTYSIEYADGAYTRGTMSTETITIGGVTVPHVPFGCAHSTQGKFSQADGLMGLGGGSVSIPNGMMFSYCLSNSYDAGWLGFGRTYITNETKWSPLINNVKYPSFYYVELVGLEVGGQVIVLDNDFRPDLETGEGGVIFDTGTTVTRLPEGVYGAIKDKFKEKMDGFAPADPVDEFDTCYNLRGVDFKTVPVMTVRYTFSGLGTSTTTLESNNVMYEAADAVSCLAFAPISSGDDQSYSVVGNMHQQGTQITIDSLGYIGFGPAVC